MSNEAQAVQETGPEMPLVDKIASAGLLNDENLREQALLGIEKLRHMSHNELKTLIAHRVEMLQTEIKERDDRQKIIGEAQLASRVLSFRRVRARRFTKRVNVGSSLIAVAFAAFMVISMIP